jgi:hypothetical protein
MGRRGAVALFVVLLVAGCGDQPESPFGHVSRADRTRFEDMCNYLGRFGFENADWLAAANKGNVKRARREVDGAREAVADARAAVDELRNPELRARLDDYVATYENYVGAANRLTKAAERRVPPDRKTENRLISDVDEAATGIERGKTELARFLTQGVPKELLNRFRAQLE